MPILVTPDGSRLSYVERGVGSPEIVLVHGWSGDWTDFAPQLEALSQIRRVVAYDRSGHGASDLRPFAPSIESYADELARVIDSIGLARPVVVVHSQGVIALEAVARHPDCVSALVLVDVPLFPPPRVAGAFRRLLELLQSEDDAGARRMFGRIGFSATDNPALQSRVLDRAMTMNRGLAAETWRIFIEHDPTEALRGCRAPVLHIDATASSDLPRARKLCPQLQSVTVERSGHYAQLVAPEAVTAAIEQFIRSSIG